MSGPPTRDGQRDYAAYRLAKGTVVGTIGSCPATALDTVCVVSELAIAHSLMGGVPLLVFLVLAAMFLLRKSPHPKTFEMSDEWTHDPILWAADEPADHGHAHALTVGGGASGKW